MNKQKKSMKKFDILLLIFISIAALIISLFFMMKKKEVAENVIIKVNGNVIYNKSIKEDNEIDVKGFYGGHNLVQIKNGVVNVIEADCRDNICKNTAPIKEAGQTIVCLPHKVLVEITGTNKKLDGVVR